MTKLDGIRITTMFAADTDFEILLGPAPAFYTNLDELTDAGLVKGREWIIVHHLSILIGGQKRARVVAAQAQASLSEIVGAEAEELSMLRDLGGGEGGTGNFNHCPDSIFQLVGSETVLLSYLGGSRVDDGFLEFQFLRITNERNHDLGNNLDFFLLYFHRSLKNRSGLHIGNLRIYDAQATTAMPKHRVFFMKLADAPLDKGGAHLELLCQ